MAEDVHWERREEVKVHPEIVSAVRLYWDLMVMESKRFGGNGVDVNREGYVYTRCWLRLVWHFGLLRALHTRLAIPCRAVLPLQRHRLPSFHFRCAVLPSAI